MKRLIGFMGGICLVAMSVSAQGNRQQLLILSADADLAWETLTIRGEYFVWANDDDVVVTLAGDPLPVTSFSDTEIVVQLPSELTAGTYLLTVSRGPDGHLKIPHPWPGQNPPGDR